MISEVTIFPNEDLMTVNQVGDQLAISNQAVYLALRKNRMNGIKLRGHWAIPKTEVENYVDTLYSRDFSKKNGKLIFDKENGRFSVSHASKYLNVPIHRIYYFIYQGLIPYKRVKCSYVIHKKDLDEKREHITQTRGVTYDIYPDN